MPKSSHEAREILQNAERVLRRVDHGQIFRDNQPRAFPVFRRNELGLGPVLGVGGFSTVRQISATRLQDDAEFETDEKSDEDDKYTDDKHLDVTTARSFIAKHCLRNGEARYAIKKLRNDLSKVDQALGILDLAVEAKVLTVIEHPNIIKMRGLAEGTSIRKDFFIVLDRLYGTLLDKMEQWKQTKKRNRGFLKIGANKPALNRLLQERLVTAYDLAAAFRYIHRNNMVYRDIKPENIGFDVRGDVKVFDFGLCEDLDPIHKVSEGLYNLTGRTGTQPYMAPEVALCKPYGKSADVYSFAILLWEILALKIPFAGLARNVYEDEVVLGTQRLPLPNSWPPYTRHLISECWSADTEARSAFERICGIIRGDLASMTNDQNILNRSEHMMERSRSSFYDNDSSKSSPIASVSTATSS